VKFFTSEAEEKEFPVEVSTPGAMGGCKENGLRSGKG
jgi:hypothetical protein